MPNTVHQQRGFILITSLVFLVVITLLAVSAMNRSTLQERMASNMRDHSRAEQAADAALRGVEHMLANKAFDSYQRSGSKFTFANNAGDDEQFTLSDSDIFNPHKDKGRSVDSRHANNVKFLNADNKNFLDPTIWGESDADEYTGDLGAYTRPKLADDDPYKNVKYYAQPFAFAGRDLNPDTAAVADGTIYYQITARAGNGKNATAVTQSIYTKHY